ncbi:MULTISPECIES: hypothetical protein [unclassified Mycobacterium]|uniref:hypothetical protein n=1 Tax=unclassified Mycobacterium TaxID=2642494 RepID=UPI0029C6CCFC|nr:MULTISPECIES: hypothetical protein [unclassified Mycobacterium]
MLGTFFAPWVKWRYDNRMQMREDQKQRITEWRDGIAVLREAEKDKPIVWTDPVERMSQSLGDSITRPPQPKLIPQNPDNAIATTKSWYVTLEPYLQDHKRTQVGSLQAQPLSQRKHSVSDLLAREVARIERDKWQLV